MIEKDKEVTKDSLEPSEILNPRIFIILGVMAGLFFWLVDALIDHFIIEPEESFIKSLFYVEGTELWMRSLVILITTVGGFYASHTFKKSLQLNILLYKYQFKLEELVDERTNELQEKTEQLEKLASVDPLTNIYNRRKFLELGNLEMSRFLRHHHVFSVFLLDIDNFKSINDKFGHDVGDIVLRDIADLIRNSTRDSDYFARWGGEEFIVLSPDSSDEGRLILADKLIRLIATQEFEKAGQVTASMGVTSSREGDKHMDEIIKRADKGLYQAKEQGKNQYQLIE